VNLTALYLFSDLLIFIKVAMLNARTPPEANHGAHIGMSGVSSTKSGTITQTDSSFEVTKVKVSGNFPFIY
jgi:hypothetical protein